MFDIFLNLQNYQLTNSYYVEALIKNKKFNYYHLHEVDHVILGHGAFWHKFVHQHSDESNPLAPLLLLMKLAEIIANKYNICTSPKTQLTKYKQFNIVLYLSFSFGHFSYHIQNVPKTKQKFDRKKFCFEKK